MAEVLYTPNGKPVSEDNPLTVKVVGGWMDGRSLEFNWDGTRLGVRVEGDEEYEYVDLQGPQGEQGPPGEQGPQGPPGADGADGRGVDNITFDSETNEFVFHMSDNTEIRIPFPSGEN